MIRESTTKIEHRTVNALERIIDDHLTMDHHFNQDDKGVSWDGYISLFFNNTGDQSKHNLEGRVPVQIKGHQDRAHKYINKAVIRYAVSIEDLRLYGTEKGVLYFQIFTDGKAASIFYASLYPSRISDYLERASRRKEKPSRKRGSINIPFQSLKADPDNLYIIAKQFFDEGTQQGSTFNPLVKDRIRCDDFDKIKSIHLTVVGSDNPFDALQRLPSGDICIYGKTDESEKYFRPLEWIDQPVFYMGRDVDLEISAGDTVYYKSYHCVADSHGEMILEPSPNIKIKMKEGAVSFQGVSSLKQMCYDARFILNVNKAKGFSVGSHTITINDYKMEEDFKRRLCYLLDLDDTAQMIGLSLDKPISEYSEESHHQLKNLVNLHIGAYNDQIPEGYSKYLWVFEGRYIPLLIVKHKDTNLVQLVNAVYDNHYGIFLPDENDGVNPGYRMPSFVYQDIDVLCNLYAYDYEALYAQIDGSDYNSRTSAALTECGMIMIHVFDKCGNVHFLELADYIFRKLSPYVDQHVTQLNLLQIKKRLGDLENEDLSHLNALIPQNHQIAFGKSVLLGDGTSAKVHFDQLSPEEQKQFETFPIYTLYKRLLEKTT